MSETKINESDALLDHLPVGIVRLNETKECIYANKFILDVLGTDNYGDLCKYFTTHVHPDDQDVEQQYNTRFLNKDEIQESTCRLFDERYKDYRWMRIRRVYMSPNTFLYVLQDIHDIKSMEIKLRQESQRAEDAYNHKTIFLANMSHEIRTPLNGIIGMLTLLEDTTLTNDQVDYISMVKECSFNLMTIINDILDYSKLEVGKIVLDNKPMHLRECIESTGDIVLSKVYEKTLEYVPSISPNVPLGIIGDNNRLKQILLNLLSNAIKFTDKGYVYLNVENVQPSDYSLLYKNYCKKAERDVPTIDSNCVYIRFDITDTGCGIADEDMDKLFKSFSQIDNRLTTKIYQGTGLGLVICKELVELMGGFIWLDWSELNKGSRFSFVIQSQVCDSITLANDVGNDDILKDRPVLIVDDNLHNRLSLVGILTKWGMRPQTFSSAEEALLFTRFSSFDLGLIDLCMPKIDGFTFAAKLKEQLTPDGAFPLIALSSLGDKVTSLSKHFKGHLVKPIKEQKLKRLCIDVLKQQNRNNNLHIQPSLPVPHTDDHNLTDIKENVRILLAEDVYINQRVIVSFLKKIGYHNVHVTDNGQQCLDMLYQHDYDIILLDIRMPVLNGEIVLQKINQFYDEHTDKRKPYVVAVTAYSLREDRDKYIKLGFDDYIPKPITLSELVRCMDKFINNELKE